MGKLVFKHCCILPNSESITAFALSSRETIASYIMLETPLTKSSQIYDSPSCFIPSQLLSIYIAIPAPTKATVVVATTDVPITAVNIPPMP